MSQSKLQPKTVDKSQRRLMTSTSVGFIYKKVVVSFISSRTTTLK